MPLLLHQEIISNSAGFVPRNTTYMNHSPACAFPFLRRLLGKTIWLDAS